ncbi:MAG: type II toxin-antitoxin system RelE/ParE family toxin [Candidatus Aminicenantes bacterium]|nr:type II toxin-antitoxin system RelE/ParE family toxin [Candidatus Aminicenantes bacterium]
MQLLETTKFRKQRQRLNSEKDKDALKKAILRIMADPATGKKMNGGLASFHFCRCTIAGRPQRLIYGFASGKLILFSLGPRLGNIKS